MVAAWVPEPRATGGNDRFADDAGGASANGLKGDHLLYDTLHSLRLYDAKQLAWDTVAIALERGAQHLAASDIVQF